MASRDLNILIKAKNLAGGAIAGVKKELRGIDKDIKRGLGNAARNLERGILLASGAAVAGLGYAVKSAADFEAALNTINTVAQLSADELARVGESIRAIARETGTPLSDLTSAYYDLVSAGIDAGAATDVLRNANTLAIGGLATTAESVDLITTALNAYGVSAEDQAAKSREFADAFAQSIGAGKVTAAELAASFAQVAPLAAAQGIELNELAAGYAQLTAAGVPAAEASTQMRAAIVALQRPTGALEKLQNKLGVSFLEIAEQEGLATAYQLMRKEADKAGIELIELTGRVEGQSYALSVTGKNWEGYMRNLELVEGAEGTAQAQAAERQQGLNFQLERAKALAHDAAVTIGTEVLPVVTELLTEFGEWLALDSTQAGIRQLAQDIGAGIREAATWAKSLDWAAIGNSLKAGADAAKLILDAFLAMPPWVQQLLVGGFAANKLTGGALGSIGGSLLGGGAKGLLGQLRGGSPATPMFTKEVGLGGAGGGVVAGGGKLGGALKFIPVIGLAALADAIEPEVSGLGADLGKGWRDAVEDAVGVKVPTINPNELEWPFGPKNTPTILPEIFGGNGLLGGTGATPEGRSAGSPWSAVVESVDKVKEETRALHDPLGTLADIERGAASHIESTRAEVRDMQLQVRAAIAAADAREAARHSLAIDRQNTQIARLDAINAKDFSPSVNVHNTTNVGVNALISVSATSVAQSIRIQQAARSTSFTGRGGDSRF